LIEFPWHRVANRIGNIHGRCTGLNRRAYNLREVGQFCSRCILGRELHIVYEFPGHFYGADRALDNLLFGHFELVLAVNRTRSHKHMNTVFLSAFDRSMNLFNVCRIAAREPTNRRAEICVGDRFDRFEVTRGRGGEAGLYDIDVQVGQRLCNSHLFAKRHAAARRLLSIAQCRIEDVYFVFRRIVRHFLSL